MSGLGYAQSRPYNRLTLVPPTPVTTQIALDVRGAVWNRSSTAATDTFQFYLDKTTVQNRLHMAKRIVAAGSAAGIRFRMPLKGRAGHHRIILVTSDGTESHQTSQPLDVTQSSLRSTKRISGAWLEFYHWSEREGRPWNSALKQMTDAQWREMVQGMHRIGFNIVVIQALFHHIHSKYVDQHHMTLKTYSGRAMYPSRLYRTRLDLAATDPLEDVLDEADHLGMHVLVGIGNFAWFDYSSTSLAWHEAVVNEVLSMYGRHPSFYGFYVSEEIDGSLGKDNHHRQQLVDFFRKFKAYCNRIAPDKVIMLASNCFHVREGAKYYPALLSHLDILCPFGFARMPAGDWSGRQAMNFLQRQCKAAGCHLWMDLEAFVFGPHGALLPRPIEGISRDLQRFTGFETILCYQYTGLFNAPNQSAHPGGPATVQAYRAYQDYLVKGPPKPMRYRHDAIGARYTLASPPARQYPGSPRGLTDGLIDPPDYHDFPWFGFLGSNMVLTIDLSHEHRVRKIGVSIMQDTPSGIYAPSRVEFLLSSDGKTYSVVGSQRTRMLPSQPGPAREIIALNHLNQKARYVRVIAHNFGVLPPGHPHAGRPAWLFVDEVGVFYQKQ